MARYSDCGACHMGVHEKHVRHWGARPEGVIDGDFCACQGDCEQRAQARFDEWMSVFDELGWDKPVVS